MLLGGLVRAGRASALMDRARPDDPAVQCEFAAELMSDAAEDLEVALAGDGVDSRDHAAPPQGVDADEHVTDGQSVAGATSLRHRWAPQR